MILLCFSFTQQILFKENASLAMEVISLLKKQEQGLLPCN